MGGASAVTALLVGLSAVSFVLAAAAYPGGYDPAMRMMSALGQTEVLDNVVLGEEVAGSA